MKEKPPYWIAGAIALVVVCYFGVQKWLDYSAGQARIAQVKRQSDDQKAAVVAEAERQKRVLEISAPLKPRVLKVGDTGSQLVVLTVPMGKQSFMGQPKSWLEDQFVSCFVWRDAELKTASMSCRPEMKQLDEVGDIDR